MAALLERASSPREGLCVCVCVCVCEAICSCMHSVALRRCSHTEFQGCNKESV